MRLLRLKFDAQRKNDRTINTSGEAAACCCGSASIDKLCSTGRSRNDSNFGTQFARETQQALWQYATSAILQ